MLVPLLALLLATSVWASTTLQLPFPIGGSLGAVHVFANDVLVYGGGVPSTISPAVLNCGSNKVSIASDQVYIIDLVPTVRLRCVLKMSVARLGAIVSAVGPDRIVFFGGDATGRGNLTATFDVININTCAVELSMTLPAVARSSSIRPGTTSSQYAYTTNMYVQSASGGYPVVQVHILPPYSLQTLSAFPSMTDYAVVSLLLSNQWWHIWAGGYKVSTTDNQIMGINDALGIYREATNDVVATDVRVTLNSTSTSLAVSQDKTMLFVLLQGGQSTPVLNVFSISITAPYLTMTQAVSLTQSRHFGALATLGPYVYLVGGMIFDRQKMGSLTTIEGLDIRDWSTFTALESLAQSATNLLVFSTPNAVYITGFQPNGALLQTLTCGNSVIDIGESCDVHIPKCAQTCNGLLA
jgi:hypothetical protein